MRIRILGAHNTESRQSRMAGLLLDGHIALDAGSLTSSLEVSELVGLKAVVLTHYHYDHVRDIPALGMNLFLNEASTTVYAALEVLVEISSSLLNGRLYPDFTSRPENRPAFEFVPVTTGKEFEIESYRMLQVEIPHSVPASGYLVTAADGHSFFYTGDAGSGFAARISPLKPDLLIVEMTASNRFLDFARSSVHLCPQLLEEELGEFSRHAGYLPRVVTVHMHPGLEDEIRPELAEVAAKMCADITPAFEGMVIEQ